MKRLLIFEIKPNSNKSPRIYVKCSTTKDRLGSFLADSPDGFNGWDHLTIEQTTELKLFIGNLNAIKNFLGLRYLNELSTYQLKLPESLQQAIHQMDKLCAEDQSSLDIFSGVITSITQSLKVAASQLNGETKFKAYKILDELGINQSIKVDYGDQIKVIFTELSRIYNKVEKLANVIKVVFADKNKSISALTIEAIAKGDIIPSKWTIACAIEVLLSEKCESTLKLLTESDIFKLWLKPLLDNGYKIDAPIIRNSPLISSSLIKTAARYLDKKES